jgi:hypothetical protein
LIKKKDDMQTNCEVGTQAFLLSRNWLKKYLDFILYEQFRNDTTEHDIKMEPDHFTKMMPGPIMNEDDLCEKDEKQENLYGTGSQTGLEHEYVDMYIDQAKSV